MASVGCSRAVCRVTEQQLYCSQIAGLLVNQCRLRSAQRVRTICRAIEPRAVRPSMDDAGVLPRRQVWLSPQTAWQQIWALASVEGGEPLADSNTGLFGDFELNRSAGLFLVTVARSRTLPPALTSSTLSRTRSQLLSLLPTARLNIARSRMRASSWSLTRIVHTSLGFKGRF